MTPIFLKLESFDSDLFIRLHDAITMACRSHMPNLTMYGSLVCVGKYTSRRRSTKPTINNRTNLSAKNIVNNILDPAVTYTRSFHFRVISLLEEEKTNVLFKSQQLSPRVNIPPAIRKEKKKKPPDDKFLRSVFFSLPFPERRYFSRVTAITIALIVFLCTCQMKRWVPRTCV
jgi:hypothetical protein